MEALARLSNIFKHASQGKNTFELIKNIPLPTVPFAHPPPRVVKPTITSLRVVKPTITSPKVLKPTMIQMNSYKKRISVPPMRLAPHLRHEQLAHQMMTQQLIVPENINDMPVIQQDITW